MSLLRIRLDLAFKLPLAPELAFRVGKIESEISYVKALAIPASESEPSVAVYHICHHDTGGECEPEKEM